MSGQAFKRVRKELKMEVSRKPLDSYAWPGGYPILYFCDDGEPICPECVNKNIQLIDEAIRHKERGSGWTLIGHEVYYEGSPIQCSHCNEEIESAYGEPEINQPENESQNHDANH